MSSGLFHCHVDNVSRRRADGRERSAVATAAYVSGTDLWNEREKKITSFGGRRDVFYSELIAPDGAPDWALDREKLWNAVEASARRRDARLAKTIVVAFSRELPKAAWVRILRDYVKPYTAAGMVADAAIHDDGTGHNPHMHVLLTVAQLKPDGFGAKIAHVDAKSFVSQARTGWEAIANKYLAAGGASVRLDSRSYKARGIAKTPTVHRGPNPTERRDRRERAARLREEGNMSKATASERTRYPHLSQSDLWPPSSERMPEGLSPDMQADHRLYWQDKRQQAERAAEEQFMERRVPEWFAERTIEAAARPEPELEAREPPALPDWFIEPEDKLRPLARDEVQPSLRDFERPVQDTAQARERQVYEDDVFRRAVLMHRSSRETELLRLAERQSPDMRERVAAELFQRRMERIRNDDDTKRLRELEKKMSRELREEMRAEMERPDEPDRYPLPGPYWEPVAPSELERAQDEMTREYERDDDR